MIDDEKPYGAQFYNNTSDDAPALTAETLRVKAEYKPLKVNRKYLYAFNSFTVVLSLVSIVTAITAFANLFRLSSNIMDLINNWKLKPFQTIKVLYSNDTCPAK